MKKTCVAPVSTWRNRFGKAVSPLIATILLVAVALAITGILYSWSQTYVKRETQNISDLTADQIGCSYAAIELSECAYNTSTGLSFWLDNIGRADLNGGIDITVIDSANNEATGTITSVIAKGAIKPIKTSTLTTASSFLNLTAPLKLIKVYPKKCSEKAATLTSCD